MTLLTGKEIQARKAIGLQVAQQLRNSFTTQDEAAKYAKVTPAQMSAVVNGRNNYTIETLTKIVIANSLNLSLSNEIFNNYKL